MGRFPAGTLPCACVSKCVVRTVLVRAGALACGVMAAWCTAAAPSCAVAQVVAVLQHDMLRDRMAHTDATSVSDAASAAPNDAPSSFHERSISCIATPRPCASARAPIPRGEQ